MEEEEEEQDKPATWQTVVLRRGTELSPGDLLFSSHPEVEASSWCLRGGYESRRPYRMFILTDFYFTLSKDS